MTDKPDWWPKNPYYPSVFTMSEDDVCEALPDPKTRTGVAGKLMHEGWEAASETILDRIRQHEAVCSNITNAPTTLLVVLSLLELLKDDDIWIAQGSQMHEDLKAAEKELILCRKERAR